MTYINHLTTLYHFGLIMSMDNLMNDSNLLNQIISQEHMSRNDIADSLKVSVQFIGKVLNGHKKLSNEKKSLLKSMYPSYFPSTCCNVPETFTKEYITEVRKNLGYSQEKFAKLLGVSRSCINKCERGERNISFAVETKIKSLLQQEPQSSSLINIAYAPNIKLSSTYNKRIKYKRFIQIDSELLPSISNDFVLLTLGDDSLYPMYESTDRVILDASVNKFIDNHIFAFNYNNVTYIRRINILPDKIKCISLNDKLDTFYLSNSDRYIIFGLIVPRIRL